MGSHALPRLGWLFSGLTMVCVLLGGSVLAQADLNLSSPSQTHDSVTLDWDPSGLDDFDKYVVLRAKGCGETLDFKEVEVIQSRTLTSYKDSGLSPQAEYTYAVGAHRLGEAFPSESSQRCVTTDPRPVNWDGLIVIAVGILVLFIAPYAVVEIAGPFGKVIGGAAGAVIIIIGIWIMFFG